MFCDEALYRLMRDKEFKEKVNLAKDICSSMSGDPLLSHSKEDIRREQTPISDVILMITLNSGRVQNEKLK